MIVKVARVQSGVVVIKQEREQPVRWITVGGKRVPVTGPEAAGSKQQREETSDLWRELPRGYSLDEAEGVAKFIAKHGKFGDEEARSWVRRLGECRRNKVAVGRGSKAKRSRAKEQEVPLLVEFRQWEQQRGNSI